MKLGDYITKTQVADSTDAMGAGYEREHARLRDLLYGEIPSERIAQLLARGREVARRELAATIDQLLSVHGFGHMTGQERDALVEHTLDMVLGLGPIEKMLKDDEITEIMVNGPDAIFFERRGSVYRSAERYDSEEQLRLVVDRIVSPLGRRVDEQSPLVNARLPEGHRVNVVIPPLSIDGTSVTIRKFRTQSFTLDELVDMDALSPEMERLLAWAVRARKNIAVSGGTGGGKTTLLNALSRLIPHAERIITIEDSAELRFDQHPHVIRLEARRANAEGRGAVTIRDLVTNALRMRPDRIIVGECRGAEALDMLQAMNTGHDGSITKCWFSLLSELLIRNMHSCRQRTKSRFLPRLTGQEARPPKRAPFHITPTKDSAHFPSRFVRSHTSPESASCSFCPGSICNHPPHDASTTCACSCSTCSLRISGFRGSRRYRRQSTAKRRTARLQRLRYRVEH